MEIEGRTVLVTGGARRVGKAITLARQALGWQPTIELGDGLGPVCLDVFYPGEGQDLHVCGRRIRKGMRKNRRLSVARARMLHTHT